MNNFHHPENCIMMFLNVLSSRPPSSQFIYYTSIDIVNTFPNIHYTLYADDSELHSETTNSTELQLCMDTIHNCLTYKNCNLTLLKPNYSTLINANSNLDYFPILSIYSSPLTPSSTVTYIGIILIPTLYSDDHIT